MLDITMISAFIDHQPYNLRLILIFTDPIAKCGVQLGWELIGLHNIRKQPKFAQNF